jgi:hypothetical protein
MFLGISVFIFSIMQLKIKLTLLLQAAMDNTVREL